MLPFLVLAPDVWDVENARALTRQEHRASGLDTWHGWVAGFSFGGIAVRHSGPNGTWLLWGLRAGRAGAWRSESLHWSITVWSESPHGTCEGSGKERTGGDVGSWIAVEGDMD